MNSLVPHVSGIVERCFCVVTALDGEIVSRHETRGEANVEAIRLATTIGGVKFEVVRRG